MNIYGVTGWKNSGKTTLVERLVQELVERGLRVSTLKHAHHSSDVDHKGRDSFRHRAAGAYEVLLATPARWALMHELRGVEEPPLEELLAKLAPVDLVLIEGYKSSSYPKIETFRHEAGHGLMAPHNPTIRAVASDMAQLDTQVPLFDLNDIKGLTNFILSDGTLDV